MNTRFRAHLSFAVLAACLWPAAHAAAQTAVDEEPTVDPEKSFISTVAPGASAVRVGATTIERTAPNRYRFSGDVDIRSGDLRLQADEVEYNGDTQQCIARGNVVLKEGSSFLTGDRIEINLETRLSTIYSAQGELQPGLILEAERLEKIGENRYRIEKATLTSCTQPTPYWSFRIGRGTVELDGYAHLRNLSFRVGRMPILYTPYLLWPVKKDRVSGFLMPQVGYSARRGAVINTAYFWAPARNFDSTFYFDYFQKDGLGAGVETRWLPTQAGRLRFTGYYIDERIDDTITGEPEGDRYRFRLLTEQSFDHGWKLLADLNEVSDIDYYLDFERDPRIATTSTTSSRLDLSRAWSYYSLNIRGESIEQSLSAGEILTQERRPEIELRGRSRQLGSSPFFLAFQTSAATLDRDFSYERYDVFPEIRVPLRIAPWLKVTPEVSLRETYYTKQRDPSVSGTAIDDSLRRSLFRGGLEIIGPSFTRVWDTPGWGFSPRLKNVLEPRITYSYVIADIHGTAEEDVAILPPANTPFDDTLFVPRFDEVDVASGDINQVRYSLSSRWFALRSRAPVSSGLALPRRIPLPGLAPEPHTAEDVAALIPEPESDQEEVGVTGTAVEFATVTLSQIFNFNPSPLSRRFELREEVDSSSFSPVNLSIRVNPTAWHSMNVTARYNILRHTVEQTTISADLRSHPHILSLNWVLNNVSKNAQWDPNDPTSEPAKNRSQMSLLAGTSMFRQKLALAAELNWDIAASHIQNQRYRIGYNTQCCGFLLEYQNRDFVNSEEREIRFLINLKGVGKLFDMQQGMR
ncbi:MAG: LPS assembly protein LptD [Acidobacteria bacterium]|nr:LPS assembly protein LptD [Acidobacteriota bacterium]